MKLLFCLLLSVCFLSGMAQKHADNTTLQVGADQFANYLPLLKNKNVALVANQTSLVGSKHLLDFLLEKKIKVKKVFSPEHGIRGDADAGEKVDNTKDPKTGITIVSLYGDNKKPKNEQLVGLDIVIFDIQDVGARFYTYLSTLHYIMEACAETKVQVLLLDRPNPNGDCVDGPLLEPKYKSFVGMHPIPIVHGMTLGELAQMINGEKWLKDSIQCNLKIIPCTNYSHSSIYTLPIKPSPNLPNQLSIRLYPTLCLFEGTVVSVGRGTDFPFQVIGVPDSISKDGFTFTPRSIPGMAKKPLYEGKRCVGEKLDSVVYIKGLDLGYLIKYYNQSKNKEKFFNSFFNKLAGNSTLQEQIKKGMTKDEICHTWEADLQSFKKKRAKYLLYKDFE